MSTLLVTIIRFLAITLSLVSAHQDYEIGARSPGAKPNIQHCMSKLNSPGREIRNVQRRAELASHLRKREVTRQGQNLTPLEASHESDKDFTLSTPESIIFASNGSCALSYQATVGNQYVAGEYIRHHVTEGQPGVPLTILLEILDWSTCDPVEDVFVEVWSCNATGVYGGVSTGNGTSDKDNTMLRGVQQTDSEGVVTFDTIFPGHYSVRANHIHLMVHTKATASAKNGTLLDLSASYVGQVFFDQDLVHEVEALPAYAANEQVLTLNEEDGLVQKELEAGSNPFMDYVRLGHNIEDGLLAWYTFGVDMSARVHATPAAYLHSGDSSSDH
ncbi:hypothetical protein H9Q69_010963 [Fusarium xylarioides]|nr:hypothetical protein H9Q69_010963 [Fusarium xylarioides]